MTMKSIFAGKLETALIRSVDEVLQPNRNVSTNEYYASLNRFVRKSYWDRCATFIAISDNILIPTVDWNYPLDERYRGELKDANLGIESTKAGGGEWDRDTEAFVKFV
jgi:hypothetical protein